MWDRDGEKDREKRDKETDIKVKWQLRNRDMRFQKGGGAGGSYTDTPSGSN